MRQRNVFLCCAATLIIGLLLGMPLARASAQLTSLNKLLVKLASHGESDTTRVLLLNEIAFMQEFRHPDSSVMLYRQAKTLAARLEFKRGLSTSLAGIGSYYLDRGITDSALYYLHRAVEVASQSTAAEQRWRACNIIGILYTDIGKHDSALKYLNHCIEISKQSGTEPDQSVLFNLGRIYYDIGDFSTSVKYYETSLKEAEKKNDKRIIAMNLYAIGNVQTDMQKSIDYYNRALRLTEELSDDMLTSVILANTGTTYLMMKRNGEAIAYLESALALAQRLHYAIIIENASQNLVTAYCNAGRPEKSRRLFSDIVNQSEIEVVRTQTIFPLLYVAKMYRLEQRYDSATYYGQLALDIAEEAQYKLELKEIYTFFSELHADMRNFESAHRYSNLASAMKDSLFNEGSIRVINEMSAKYESAQREKTIALLQNEKTLREIDILRQQAALRLFRITAERNTQQIRILKQEQQIHVLDLSNTQIEVEKRKKEISLLMKDNQLKSSILAREQLLRNSVLGGLALTFVIGLLGYRRIQGNRREVSLRAEMTEYQLKAAEVQAIAMQFETERKMKEAQQNYARKLIELQEQDRNRIAGDLHDSVGQDALVIKNQIYLIMNEMELNTKIREELEGVIRITSMMLDDVRRISRNLRPVQLEQAGLTETLRDMLFKMSAAASLRIEPDIGMTDKLFFPEQEIHIYRIVQEGINNIVRHSRASEARVELRIEQDEVVILISDNGTGISPEALAGLTPGLGLRGMTDRANILGGTMHVDSSPGDGTRISLRIPLQAAAAQRLVE